MTVKHILSEKGGKVVTIAPTASLADAAKLLAERRIGALVVTGAGERVVGIVSERDIVRILAARGAAGLGLSLTDVMTRKVVTCEPTSTVGAIMEESRVATRQAPRPPGARSSSPSILFSMKPKLPTT